MVRPYTWLLDRVGTDGIRLTEAGHLPPAEVSAAMCELNLAPAAMGGGRTRCEPVRQLRESAQAMGLLRKQRGQLLLTAAGPRLRSDPAALWWHLAERMPLRSAGRGEIQPGLIMLVCVAARSTGTLNATIAADADRDRLDEQRRQPAVRRPGRAGRGQHPGRAAPARRAAGGPCPGCSPWPTPEGVAFARAALRTWPGPGGYGPSWPAGTTAAAARRPPWAGGHG